MTVVITKNSKCNWCEIWKKIEDRRWWNFIL